MTTVSSMFNVKGRVKKFNQYSFSDFAITFVREVRL
jgi:hypothetical protein